MRTFIPIAALLLCPVLQVGATDPPQPADMRGGSGPLFVRDATLGDEASYEEQQFEQRFNKLVNALRGFSETYNSGHVVDVKRVKAVKKAWRDLEKSDWFKPDKTN